MKSSKNKKQFQLSVYRPGFKDIGNVHVFPTLETMVKNQKILEGRGFVTEMMRNGKIFDPDKIKKSKEKRDIEKRSKLMDTLLGSTHVENQLNFEVPSINASATCITTGPYTGPQYPGCIQHAMEASQANAVTESQQRGMSPNYVHVDELSYIETED